MHSSRPAKLPSFGVRASKRAQSPCHDQPRALGRWEAIAALLVAGLLSGCGPLPRFDEVVGARVQGVTRRIAHRLVTVRTSSTLLVTTPEHPFARVGAGWTRAADLKRGDRIQIADGSDTTVVRVESRPVKSTGVHNLTVGKTHTYFVGSQGLLVHNTNCAGPASPRQGRVRQREEDPAAQQERFRARRAHRKAQLQAKRREREQYWMEQDPFNDMPDTPNCVLCSLAGLSDVDRLSTLLRQKNLDSDEASSRITATDMWRLLDEWGLRNANTPPRGKFPEIDDELEAARTKVWEDYLDKKPRPSFPFQERAKHFMESSSANTFLVSFEYLNGEEYDGHTLLAVKRDDGSITYIDLQTVPPTVYDNIDPSSTGVIVTPTSVDWRGNRQLSNVVENGVHVPVLIAWEGEADSVDEPVRTPQDGGESSE